MSYQPKTGARCSCKRGQQRDNCPSCEGTGWVIDFAAIRRRTAERLTNASRARAPEGLYPGESPYDYLTKDRDIRYKATGEYRPPKRGEYYLSGAIIAAYRALNDLDTSYWIAVPGRITTTTTTTWEALRANEER